MALYKRIDINLNVKKILLFKFTMEDHKSIYKKILIRIFNVVVKVSLHGDKVF